MYRAFLVFVLAIVATSNGCERPVPAKIFPGAARNLLSGFAPGIIPSSTSYDSLFVYFLEGFETFHSQSGSLTTFPGLRSRHGAVADGMEGFARIAPMWAAWSASGRPVQIMLPDRSTVDLLKTLQLGILSGTDPRSSGSWGAIHDLDQRIVEASDIALALWLTRDSIWIHLDSLQRQQIGTWLYQVNDKLLPDNNWHLFVTFINVVLEKLGCPYSNASALNNYKRIKQFYRGHGWFSDGPANTFDYYNAWAIHYLLYWLQQVDPTWDSAFITASRREFMATFRFFPGVTGVPIFGRSICYRTAAIAPFVFASNELPAGMGRRALDTTWSYFIQHNSLENGNLTQGYCRADPRILDNYSGPASCLWGLRSLIVAFAKSPHDVFWTEPASPLEVERGDFSLLVQPIGWEIKGYIATQSVELVIPSNRREQPVQEYSWWRQLASAALWRPFRPENTPAKYQSHHYDSARPFCGCL